MNFLHRYNSRRFDDSPPAELTTLVLEIIILGPHITGRPHHNPSCVFSKFWQISTLLLHLVNCSHHRAVVSASAWQTRGRGFEPVLMPYIFSGKYPGA